MAGPTVKPYNMSQIKSKLLQPALTSQFICQFAPPSNDEIKDFFQKRFAAGFKGVNYIGENQELIEISCAEASLPGSSIATNEINNDYSGVTERHAYRRLYDDRADFTFYVDSNYYVIDYFENWIAFITGERDIKEQRGPTFSYRVNFPNNYKTPNLYITKFEKNHTKTDRGRPLTYQFINAYPISINSMPVSYDSSQLLKCTVSFTYSRYVLSRDLGQYSTGTEEPVQQTSREFVESAFNRLELSGTQPTIRDFTR